MVAMIYAVVPEPNPAAVAAAVAGSVLEEAVR
jgi:hypothetical protein